MTRPTSARSAGFTLIELLIALVVLSIVMGISVSLLRSQSAGFRKGGENFDMAQNERFATGTIQRSLRAIGAGVEDAQPMLVYGGNDVLAFNVDYAQRDTGTAIYTNPETPLAAVDVWRVGAAAPIPNTTYTYPPVTFTRPSSGTPSKAETMIFFFTPDTTTVRADDYVLYQQINATAPEVVSRNLLAYTGRPFFEYFIQRRIAGVDSLEIGAGADLPLIGRWPPAGNTSADTADALRPDSVRATRVNFRVTNGYTGANERIQNVSMLINMPNNGLRSIQTCGDRPLAPASISAAASPGSNNGIDVTWTASPDEAGGERDIGSYSVYRRVATDPLFGAADQHSAIQTVKPGINNYHDASAQVGTIYWYAVTASDCNPLESNQVVSGPATPNP